MKPLLYTLSFCFLVATSVSCSSSSDDTPSATSTDNTGAAVAAIFGTSGDSNITASLPVKVLEFFVRKARAQGTPDMCDESLESGPANVTMSYSGSAGSYGSASAGVTLTADEFCQDSDGTENSGDGLYITFVLSSATADCSDGSTVEMTSGEGVARNFDSHYPEVHGVFTVGGEAVNCTIFINEDQSVDSADCSDSTGTTVELTSDVTCTIDAG